ncbi:MAG: hypothetical protein PHF56_24350 [Desulfuromonadaceae bacterium]|nr:hypothetical protein [Desulfuromonadaceae bacterium]
MNNKSTPIDVAVDLSDKNRFRSALAVLQEANDASTHPIQSLICTYNLGAIQWSQVGNGQAARELFLEAIRIAKSGQVPVNNDVVSTILGNSCENLMLLSLSYEEYEDWSRQLRELQPTNDILRGQVPKFLNARDEGLPWSDMLQHVAMSYYNRNDPKTDIGRYGCGAATWHLLLANRNEQNKLRNWRILREDWQIAVYEFGALTMRIASDAMLVMEKSSQGGDLTECMFIVEPAVTFVDEYLAVDPNDELIGKLKSNLSQFISSAKYQDSSTASPFSPNVSRGGAKSFPDSLYYTLATNLLILGLIFGWFKGGKVFSLIGGIIGLLIAAAMYLPMRINFRSSRCEHCSRGLKIGPPMASYFSQPGSVMLDRKALESGREGVGRLCKKCGRIVCSSCNHHVPCACGAKEFRGVRLMYPESRGM